MCTGQQTGYYCPTDSGGFLAFACMDWTFQSTRLSKAQATFNARNKDDVFFGLGTYGTSDDAMRGLGACYRLTVSGVSKPLLVQSINTGSDVAGNQFDLQIGDGGAGAFNNCAGKNFSMFPGSYDAWGKQYGGVDNRAQCSGLPKYPKVSGPMRSAGDDLVSLCEAGFDQGVRQEGGGNPTIQDIKRVKCPEELVELTWLQRTDEPSDFDSQASLPGFPNFDHQCQADQPGGGTAYCLTRMMDCRKPSGGFIDNLKQELLVTGRRVVQPCTQDGYTRIDVQCGCAGCYC